jgi:hypothetical protein
MAQNSWPQLIYSQSFFCWISGEGRFCPWGWFRLILKWAMDGGMSSRDWVLGLGMWKCRETSVAKARFPNPVLLTDYITACWERPWGWVAMSLASYNLNIIKKCLQTLTNVLWGWSRGAKLPRLSLFYSGKHWLGFLTVHRMSSNSGID